ncbi:hypothetical protein HME9304_00028 [Flagellimonas maritima]|uniref:Uncharacterized protein n=1 Tax=Flagellimonas maritima TaxID=1383885 RepID=A0A2Z4LMJ4_9FLAO|nr:hypothetical protein [Allomuricauda aurantiaca]AWX43041.1 hypothetical protein HME9304_00028 [Allomuricauda aurantiaca]
MFGNTHKKEISTDSLVVKDSVVHKKSVAEPNTTVQDLWKKWEKEKGTYKASLTPEVSKVFRSFPELDETAPSFHYNFSDNLAEFTEDYVRQQFQNSAETNTTLAAAAEVFDIIEREQRFINIITGNIAIELPVGVRQELSSGSSLTLGVIRMKYHKDYTEVDLFARLQLAELNVELMFGANGVRISRQGGIYEEAQLSLLSNVPVGLNGGQWLVTFLGGMDKQGGADESTYVTIDCEGKIKELGLAADVRIAKTVALPLNADGTLKYPGKTTPGTGENVINNDSYVGTNFSLQTAGINDLLIELDLPYFELRALPKWGFNIQNAILDLSDTKNAEGLEFPKLYTTQQLLVPDNENLWRGFYADEVSITLPPEFKKRNSEERITIGARELLIDNFGVSGDFYAMNVMNLNEGDASKWQFSLDSIGVDLKVNRFIKAGFNGEIVLPISNGKVSGGKLAYRGLITADQFYSVTVDVVEDVDFNIFRSKAKLFRDSYIKLEVENDRFYPEANLTGMMSFTDEQENTLNQTSSSSLSSENGIESLEFEGLSFQDFKIQTRERPYLSIGYAGYRDSITTPKLAGFELGFYEISIRTENQDQAILAFNSYINLDKTGIKGDVGLNVIGELQDGDYLKWRYKKIEVSSVEVDVKRKGFEFYGHLDFFRDNTIYGKGFAGELNLYSESIGIEVGAKGIFGSTDGYRYWLVDAHGRPTRSNNPNFTIYDIGGGVYHHMRKAGMDERADTMSGIYYAPDKNVSLGFKALAAFEVKRGASFTGLVALEMSFNSQENGGGISRLGFYGAAALIQGGGRTRDPFGSVDDMQQTVSDSEQALGNFHELSIDKEGIKYFADEVFPQILTGDELFAAQVAIDFDFTNHTYWGMCDVFLNAGPIKGAGEKNRLGYLEFYNAPDDWYIYVGTPTKRFGLQGIPIGPLTAKIDMYFMTGTILPDPARPPHNVIEILNLSEDDLSFNRNFNQQLAEGAGYVFGASFEVGKEIDWGIIYASIRAGVGFDLMMRDFGDAHCLGKSGPLGMDGWYATGQLYAYLQGEIGAQIKLFGMRKRVRILKAGIAVLAQAQLPNPWYMKGYAGVDVRVLGVVRIRSRLKVVIGEECEIVGKSGLQDIIMISDISPRDGFEDVDVFEAVQVAFNAPVGSIMQIEDETDRQSYRMNLKEFLVTSEGNPIQGETEFNETKDLAIFKSFEILPPEQEIRVMVKVSFEKWSGSSWMAVTDNGKPVFEEKEVRFVTADAPRNIPYHNIEYMYPVVDQKYMLPKESTTGYVQLNMGQAYLFGNGYKDKLYFLNESGNKIKADFQYVASQKRLNFSIPNLENETTYTYALVTLNPSDVDESLVMTSTQFNEIQEDLEISTNTIVGSAANGAFISRLDFPFTTSRHDTFRQKMNALRVNNTITYLDGYQDSGAIANVARMSLIMEEYEPFSTVELVGSAFTQDKPLIDVSAVLNDQYYIKDIYPLVYEEYPLDNNLRVQRNASILGMPPKKSIQLSSNYVNYVLADVENNFVKTYFPYRWHLPIAFYTDFKDLQYQVTNRYMRNGITNQAKYDTYEYIIFGRFPFMRKENYRVRFSYVLPNKTSGNSENINYKNSL